MVCRWFNGARGVLIVEGFCGCGGFFEGMGMAIYTKQAAHTPTCQVIETVVDRNG